jgi:hypothetical protein
MSDDLETLLTLYEARRLDRRQLLAPVDPQGSGRHHRRDRGRQVPPLIPPPLQRRHSPRPPTQS